MKEKQVTKDELDFHIKIQFGYLPSLYCGWYGIKSWRKDNLIALNKIFRLYKIHCNTTITLCCLTKAQMAKQLEHYYGRYGLKFTPHEINYISREGFIVLYNNLIEGVK